MKAGLIVSLILTAVACGREDGSKHESSLSMDLCSIFAMRVECKSPPWDAVIQKTGNKLYNQAGALRDFDRIIENAIEYYSGVCQSQNGVFSKDNIIRHWVENDGQHYYYGQVRVSCAAE